MSDPIRKKRLKLRELWLQIHKWLGLSLLPLIIPIALTGSALVWHDWLDESLNPVRHSTKRATRSPDFYAGAATKILAKGEKIVSIAYPESEGSILVTAARPPVKEGRPIRTLLWLDPESGHQLDRKVSDAGLFRVMHNIHGSLMVPGVGRQIVGWIGAAMLISSLTGLWLWWPLKGRWTKGLRWRRRDNVNDNLHHMAGFWVAVPLAMLSFTGMWISFPPFFARVSGAPSPPPRSAPAKPLAETAMTPGDAVRRVAIPPNGRLATISWPTEKVPQWKIAFSRGGADKAEVGVNDVSGKTTPASSPQPETLARTMRRLHDGTGMGPVWQTLIFVGGIIPAVLGVTGFLMWLRTRKWRSNLDQRRRSQVSAPAE